MEALAYNPADTRRNRSHRSAVATVALPSRSAVVPRTAARPVRSWVAVRRVQASVAIAACIGIAVGYFAIAYHMVFQAHIGYTVVEAGPTHGVDSGDMLALPFVLLTALCLIFAVYFYAELVGTRRGRRWRAR
jgi:ABC-type branched-subunit amino acid transport system permease subunit